MLKLENISIHYNNTFLLSAELHIPINKITLIRGINGSGKTSLLYRAGLISNDKSYKYLVDDFDLITAEEKEKSAFRQKHLSFVFQDNPLFEQYDLLGNLKIHAQFNNKDYSEEEKRNILKKVKLDIPLNMSIEKLSGGERQRLAIACCLCKDTDIIILDEPTSFLDEENELLIFSLLKDLSNSEKKTIILSSHSKNAIP